MTDRAAPVKLVADVTEYTAGINAAAEATRAFTAAIQDAKSELMKAGKVSAEDADTIVGLAVSQFHLDAAALRIVVKLLTAS